MIVREYLKLLDQLPIGTLADVAGKGPFVVLSPHPDDETLGCGGLIAAACGENRRVDIVIVTDGSGSHPRSRSHPPEQLAALRRHEVSCATQVLGMPPNRLTFLDLPDTAAPSLGATFDMAVEAIIAVVDQANATTLMVTWRHDPHCDHVAAAAMADEVCAKRKHLRLWHYPIWGLHLPPEAKIDAAAPRGIRVPVGAWSAVKRKALHCHASQMTTLIDDDPEGFRFTDATLAPFVEDTERFIAVLP